MPDSTGVKQRNFEITRDSLIFHFYDEAQVIPLWKIGSYHLDWHLHEPIFAKKWWFLVLTVRLKDGEEQSGPVAFVNFNYLGNDRQERWDIQTGIENSIDAALAGSRSNPPRRKTHDPLKSLATRKNRSW